MPRLSPLTANTIENLSAAAHAFWNGGEKLIVSSVTVVVDIELMTATSHGPLRSSAFLMRYICKHSCGQAYAAVTGIRRVVFFKVWEVPTYPLA